MTWALCPRRRWAPARWPLFLAVVPIKAPYRLETGPLAPLVRAEVATAQAFFKMAAAARQSGVLLQVTSGFRTIQQQRELYALYLSGRGPLAARPGSSNHQSGHALDLETRSPQVRRWVSATRSASAFAAPCHPSAGTMSKWDLAEPEAAGSLRP